MRCDLKKVELLAPAGHKDALIGAINAGADAIYLAGKRFGARAYANNFSDEELIETIDYAHVRGVRVFVAINTLVFDDEVEDLISYADFLVKHHVDALIVQDLGMIDLFVKRYPDTEIHVSTQFNTHNLYQVKMLKALGVKRIVLARETSIQTIKAIKKEVDIELEVFIHGALCVSYSGNCLMSSMIGGRSGNRGECAQPCRLPYQLYKDNQKIQDSSYLLSTKDLMTIDYIGELIDLGINSFKIEGRMRKKEYVIETVKAYRHAIDQHLSHQKYDSTNDIDRLKRVFNREFTKGFVLNEVPRLINNSEFQNHLGVPLGKVIGYQKNRAKILLEEPIRIGDGYRILSPEPYGDIVSRIHKKDELVKEALENEVIELDVKNAIQIGSIVVKTTDVTIENEDLVYLSENYKCVKLNGKVTAKVGQHLKLDLSDGFHQVSVSSAELIEQAEQNPTSREEIELRFSKLGNTPFEYSSLEIENDENGFIPVKMINQMRRDAIDQLVYYRTLQDQERKVVNVMFDPLSFDDEPQTLKVKVKTMDQYQSAISCGIEEILIEDTLKVTDIRESDVMSLRRIQTDQKKTIEGVSYIHDIGSILLNSNQYDLYGDQFLNVTNIYSAYTLFKLGLKRITFAYEVSKDRIFKFMELFEKKFQTTPPVDLILYGRPDLMMTKYCPIAKTYKTNPHCHLCEKNQYALEDRLNQKYPLLHDGSCHLRILHSKPIHLFQYMDELKMSKISGFRIDLTIENAELSKKIIQFYQHKEKNNPVKDYTSGRFIK